MSNEKDYTDVLLEEVIGQNKAVLEIVGSMQVEMKSLAKQKDLEEVKTDLKTVKAAVTATNADVRDHKRRIAKLETKAA